jgi:hypothetical protein
VGITATYYDPGTPFYTGTVAQALVTSGAGVQIADHFYLLDMESDRYRIASVPAIRAQADTSERVGAQSLTVEGLWRTAIASWDRGAGQMWYDRADADPRRFETSRGVDPWEQWHLTLLPGVASVDTDAGGWSSTAIGAFTGGHRLVAVGLDQGITITPALGLTTIAGLTGNLWATSNGSTVYVAASDGVYTLNAAGTGGTMFNTNVNAASRIGFAKNRLIATVGAQLWDVIDGTTASPHYTNPWPGWAWTGITEGSTAIFACGYAGDKGLVYSVAVKDDGTGLDAPRVALPLPDGELPYSIYGYLGFVIIGTSKGVRLATEDDQGHLTMGALVGEGQPCRCLEPQDRFVWFGMDDVFADAGGLGRMDLTEFVEPLAPAYATDLMGLEAGDCTAVATFDDRRFFAVGQGLYVQDDDLVASGYLETGCIQFNIADNKVAVFVDLLHDVLRAGESVDVDSQGHPDTTWTPAGSSDVPATDRPISVMSLNHSSEIGHRLRLTLNRGTDTTAGPTVTGVIMAAQPAPQRSFHIFLPLLLADAITVDNAAYHFDVPAELEYLRRLCHDTQLVRYVSGSITHLVFVEDYEWIPHHRPADRIEWAGTMVVKLKSAELAT